MSMSRTASEEPVHTTMQLLEYSKMAIRTLEDLLDRKDAAYVGPPSGRVPPSALRACHSIAFFESVKAGVGLSITHGWGFLLSRHGGVSPSLPHGAHITPLPPGSPATTTSHGPHHEAEHSRPAASSVDTASPHTTVTTIASDDDSRGHGSTARADSAACWSSPCFLSLNEVGVGLTVGVSRVHTCMLLWNEAAVNQILAGKGLLGSDVHIVAGNEAAQRLLHVNPAIADEEVIQYLGSIASRAEVSTYSISEGAIVDCSLSGGRIHVNHGLNQKLYGKDLADSPAEILSSAVERDGVRQPAEFGSLYEFLREKELLGSKVVLGQSHVVQHSTASNL